MIRIIKNTIKTLMFFSVLSCSMEAEMQENIFLGIDSLTEGAGDTTYRDFFYKDSISSRMGYIPIDYKSTKDIEISVFMTKNMKWFPVGMDYSSSPKKYSLDGKGAFTNFGNGDRCVFNISKINNYNKVGLFYLKQPEGGSFVLSTSNIGKFSDKLNINTKSENLEIGYTEVATELSDRLNIDSIYGKVTVFGIYFKNSDFKTDIVNTFAKGGVKLNQISNLDRNFRKEWFKVLKPTIYVLNAGMNDRKLIKPEIFKQNLLDFIEDIVSGSPRCKVVLVEPNESDDYSRTFLVEYREIRKELAQGNKNVYYYSIPKNIGDYQFFTNNNMMLDKVHPNQKGNKIIGESLYKFCEKLN